MAPPRGSVLNQGGPPSLGRPAVERLAGGSTALEASDLFFERYGDKSVLIARLLPFMSFDIISYGAGLTSMGFWRFFIATGIGQLPATLVYSYLGQNLTGSVKVLFFIFCSPPCSSWWERVYARSS